MKRHTQARVSWRPRGSVTLTIIAALLPLLVITYLIHKYAVAVPFWDEWEVTNLMRAFHEHHLTFSSFWMQHNEHRIVFPRLIMLGMAITSHWNIMLEMIASVVTVIATCGMLFVLLFKTFGRSAYFAMLGLLLPWIIFSPVQWENWLWGFQLAWFMTLLAVVLAIWALVMPARWLGGYGRAVVLALITATVATYSLGSGIMIWPVGLGILLALRKSRSYIIAWVSTGLPVAGAYFVGYQSPSSSYSSDLIFREPVDFAHHFLTLLGRPLGYDITSSSMVGIILLLVFAGSSWYLVSRKQLSQALPWLGLSGFTLLSTALTSFSRFGAGVNQAMSSRYYVVTCLFLLSVLVLGFMAVRHYRQTIKQISLTGPIAVTLLLLGIVMNNYFYGAELMGIQHKNLQTAYDCTHSAVTGTEPCLTSAYPEKKYVWDRIKFLRSIHWGGF